MKKLSNTEGELKKSSAYKEKRVILNYRKFSYFRPFTHDIITQNITHSKIYIFTEAILQLLHLGKGRE